MFDNLLLTDNLPRKENIFKTIRKLDNSRINGSMECSHPEDKPSTKKFYMPNNAVLVVAGDFKPVAKQWIHKNTLVVSKKDQL
jgi:hypothetical protein